jgi:hypothetical protein
LSTCAVVMTSRGKSMPITACLRWSGVRMFISASPPDSSSSNTLVPANFPVSAKTGSEPRKSGVITIRSP